MFAPTDEAFAALPTGTVESLVTNVPALQNILLYPVLGGRESLLELLKGSTAETLQGTPLLVVKEGSKVLVNRQPQGEPQLGRRGLYRAVGGAVDAKSVEMAYLWVLSLADGDHSIDDVVEIAGLDRAVVDEAIRRLADSDLVTGAR